MRGDSGRDFSRSARGRLGRTDGRIGSGAVAGTADAVAGAFSGRVLRRFFATSARRASVFDGVRLSRAGAAFSRGCCAFFVSKADMFFVRAPVAAADFKQATFSIAGRFIV